MDEDQKTIDMFNSLSPKDQEEIYNDSEFSLKLSGAVDRLEAKKKSGVVQDWGDSGGHSVVQSQYGEQDASPDVFPMTDGHYIDPKLEIDRQLNNNSKQTTNKIRSGLNGLTLGNAPGILESMGEDKATTDSNYRTAQDTEPEMYAIGAGLSPNPLGKLGAAGTMAGIGLQNFSLGQNNANLHGSEGGIGAGADQAMIGMAIQAALNQLLPGSGGMVEMAAQKLKGLSDSGLARFLGFNTQQIARSRASGELEKLINDATMARHGEDPILSMGIDREGALTNANKIDPYIGNEASALDAKLPGMHTGEVADQLADQSLPKVGLTSTEAPYYQQVMGDASDYYRNMTPKSPEDFQSIVPASVLRSEKSDAARMMYPAGSSSLDSAMPSNKGTNIGYGAKRQLFSDMHDDMARQAGLSDESALVNQNIENNKNIISNLNNAEDPTLAANSAPGITTRLIHAATGSRATSFVGLGAKKAAEKILNSMTPDIEMNAGPYIRALNAIQASSHPDVDMEIWRESDPGFNRFMNEAQEGKK